MTPSKPDPRDELFVMVVRLPLGEATFMEEAMVEAADTMNEVAHQHRVVPLAQLQDSDEETALKALGLWTEDVAR